jgi:hypothetical protein
VAAQERNALEGNWKLVGNRYKSDVELRFAAGALQATIGCRDVVYAVTATGSSFDATGEIVRQAACRLSERSSSTADAYWTQIQNKIELATTAEVRGDHLVLKGPAIKLVFERRPR